MEDPWGDPWATDAPIELPAAVHVAKSTAARPVSDAWSTDYAQGWAAVRGPAWGASPAFRPTSPDPWAGVESPVVVAEGHGISDDGGCEPSKPACPHDEAVTERALVVDVDPDGGRQPSSKVQELVELYDGMARKSASTTGPSPSCMRDDDVVLDKESWSKPSRDSREETTAQDPADSTRDEPELTSLEDDGRDEPPAAVEKGVAEQATDEPASMTSKYDGKDEPPSPVEQTPDASGPTTATDDDREEPTLLEDSQDAVAWTRDAPVSEASIEYWQDEDTATVKAHDAVASTQGGPASTTWKDDWQDEPPEKTAKVSYPIDLSTLDSIFPSVPPLPESEPVPISPANDTFTSVSERKAWYRISRPGSMRRHDLGDEDGYTRVGWAKSRTRERTLKIVRRWMEEDSIGTRPGLGRRLGSGASMVFNWDSPAAPVKIGELLKREKKEEEERVAGKTSAVAAFDWSTSLSRTPGTSDGSSQLFSEGQARVDSLSSQSHHKAQPSNADVFSQPVDDTPSLKAPMSIPAISKPPAQVAAAAAADDFDDDDDWGEMISASSTLAATNSPWSVGTSNRMASHSPKPIWSGFGANQVSPARDVMSSLLPSTPTAGSAASRPLMLKGSPLTDGFGGRLTEDEVTIMRILGGIPDLSYMLR
ncbi:hypothetical protein XA68_11411 [Ophiocordyceps unilateralis]|uniref:Uncharacterized protein n=1 Tax=Ophiocordyceps unilateralis TaxID=268505 RepID=A0A2A9PFM9_OPHUN|nr:hypothetical protein XA68_11411 [Ophiocordyceps unilateralis]